MAKYSPVHGGAGMKGMVGGISNYFLKSPLTLSFLLCLFCFDHLVYLSVAASMAL